MDPFVHLEAQSAYSFLWGTFTPEDLVRAAADLGQSAVALTDEGIHGVVRFYRAALAASLQPIVGAKLALDDGSPIVLLARSFHGYGHLCRILSLALQSGLSPRLRVTPDALRPWTDGLICLAGAWARPFSPGGSAERRNEPNRAGLLRLKQAFPAPESLFVLLHHHGLPDDDARAARIEALAAMLGLPVAAANAVAFLRRDDYVLHQTLVGIQTHHHHRRVAPLPNDSFYLASGAEMARRLPCPEALANTRRIAELCRPFELPIGRLHPPSIHPPAEVARRLGRVCLKELARRRRPVPPVYLHRLDRELAAIKDRAMGDFFLLVRDLIEFARREGIRHSVRGSAAGSLVVYLTCGGVDPVAHDLLFERFINEGRADMPDVDIDFDSERRDEVIHYLMNRFPRQTAMVGTIHTLRVRSAVRLAARALGYSLGDIKRLSTCLPWSLRGYDLPTALEVLPELRDTPLRREARLVELACRLSRLPFQTSVHLGGVIIAPDDIAHWTPTGLSPKGLPVGQLDKDDVDALGLLKLDVLGLRMHTAIRKALEVLRQQGRVVRLEDLPLDDRRTYALLRRTDSLGVFQVESPGQRSLLGRLQPRLFSDLISEISLFRPGPVQGNIVDPFVRRRNGEEPPDVLHPALAPLLADTYGVLLFQEQVLRIAHVFAGLSYAEADAFRRAMTKDRKSRRMHLLEQRFLDGAEANGHDRDTAADVFRQLSALAAYGFCKAHAASFAHITYQSAYLKAHHPQAFYLGLLNAGQVGSYPASVILNEARRRGVPIYPPHVNRSGSAYAAEGRGIRAPLVVIHEVGPALAGRIAADRDRCGPFTSREHLARRLALPARTLDRLTLAGALEGLEEAPELLAEAAHG